MKKKEMEKREASLARDRREINGAFTMARSITANGMLVTWKNSVIPLVIFQMAKRDRNRGPVELSLGVSESRVYVNWWNKRDAYFMLVACYDSRG